MSIYKDVLFVGGNGGTPFQAMGAPGSLVRSIQVWKGHFGGHPMIKAIRVSFTDDSPSKTYGEPKGDVDYDHRFTAGERIESLSLWGNGNGKRLGRIRFNTTRGKFDTEECDGKNEYVVDVGSGLLVGFVGCCGKDIDQLGFKFVKQVRKVEMSKVEYPTLNFDTPGINPVSLEEFDEKNSSKQDLQWSFSGSREVTTESRWTTTVGIELYEELSVTTKFPEVGEIQGKFGWKLSKQSSEQKSNKRTTILEWSQSGTLKPGESIHLAALTREGRLHALNISSDMTITTTDGESETFRVAGTYEGIAYSDVSISNADQTQPELRR